ncbi:MAG: hypothetical protein JOY78_00265 [Pseudonocardia sp.]|nr:hypothetical protein [Pseudonocardia sp.]
MPLELQARIKANTPQPADYAPRHTPLDERVPSGAATIATVVSGSRLARSTQVEANGDPIEYPQGEPSTKWGRDELDAYALRQHGLDTSDLPNKGAVLTAIKEGKS